MQNAAMNSETTATPADSDPPIRLPVPWVAGTVLICGVVMAVIYWYQTRLPDHLVIAGGPDDGRYDQVAFALKEELEARLDLTVSVRHTEGSLENLQLLESGEVAVGLYQSETRAILEEDDHRKVSARFIANLFPEYLIPVVSAKNPVDLPQLQQHTVSCNDHNSGDHAMLVLLMEHLGHTGQPDYSVVPYLQLPEAFHNGTVDLAIISCGLEAPVLRHVLETGDAKLAPVPWLDSLVSRNPAIFKRTIPAGYFSTSPVVVPVEDFDTATTQAQLLASGKTPVRVVEEVTRIVMDPRFQRQLRLTELASGGKDYAQERPEFPLHVGASHIYNPELKPLLNPDFVEGTEGIRSFLVSIIAAIWLTRRWWKRRELLSQEHKLDRYIRDVLKIERDQIGIDGEAPDDAAALQEMLDRVTHLRQAALAEFNAHELNEDQAVDCFVEMCHALSDKISGKLTRHTLNQLAAKVAPNAPADRDLPAS